MTKRIQNRKTTLAQTTPRGSGSSGVANPLHETERVYVRRRPMEKKKKKKKKLKKMTMKTKKTTTR